MRTSRIAAAGAVAAAFAATAWTAPGAGAASSPDPLRARPVPVDQVAASAEQAVAALAAPARLGSGQALSPTRALRDTTGATHTRMDRTYRGLAVRGGDLVVHQAADGTALGVSQTLAAPLTLATTPEVAAAAALRTVARGIGRHGVVARGTQPRLVVDATSAAPRLAWEVVTGGRQADGQTPSRLTTRVDALTGAILSRSEGVVHADGSGQTLYSGTVPLTTTLSGSTYQLKDATRGGGYTTDLNNRTDSIWCQIFGIGCSNGTLMTDADNLWGNGSTTSRQSAGADAQYGTNETWDYYQQVHARNGIWGTGRASFNRVHYGNAYVNAFWDGTKMTYGDGDATSFGPLVSLDVAGHEMSHGVTENSAGLTYSGESGGLNESTSDIFGTMVEFFAANPNDPGDYLIGEEFDLKKHVGFRRMDNPSSDGKSVSCWSSSVGNLDVHYSSGVGNHFFYLLAEGSGARTIGGVAHNSTTCNGSAVTGIGRDAAQRIWYRALTVYMTSSTNYKGARTASLNAARDLYGLGSAPYNSVAAAWSAVSVV